ncbi:hypothetical protein BHE74_00041945 [Ensete ventricosum]|nr:hypothetical protein BHE74_00041945 [Ensete ventricosum]
MSDTTVSTDGTTTGNRPKTWVAVVVPPLGWYNYRLNGTTTTWAVLPSPTTGRSYILVFQIRMEKMKEVKYPPL